MHVYVTALRVDAIRHKPRVPAAVPVYAPADGRAALWQYEEEITYLRAQIEAAGGKVQPRDPAASSVPAKLAEPPGGGISALANGLLAASSGTSLLDLYAGGAVALCAFC